jgi:hypothetical protein
MSGVRSEGPVGVRWRPGAADGDGAQQKESENDIAQRHRLGSTLAESRAFHWPTEIEIETTP